MRIDDLQIKDKLLNKEKGRRKSLIAVTRKDVTINNATKFALGRSPGRFWI